MSADALEPMRRVMRNTENQLKEAHDLLRWIVKHRGPDPETDAHIKALLVSQTGRVE